MAVDLKFSDYVSAAALVVSILTAVFTYWSTHKTNDRAWKREVYTPFYRNLNKILDKIDTKYLINEGRGKENYTLFDLINEANTLGLDRLSSSLYELQFRINDIDYEMKKRRKVKEATFEKYVIASRSVWEYVQDDTRSFQLKEKHKERK